MNVDPNNTNQWHLQDAHQIAIDQLLTDLSSSQDGLSTAEAQRRLKTLGANILEAKQQKPEWLKFLEQLRNYFAILLLIGGVLALVAEQLEPGQGNLYIAYALIAVVILNAIFTYLQEHQTERIMESFTRLLPQMVTVLRDGQPSSVRADEVVPGDVMIIAEGDRICADGRLLKHSQLKIDLSSLTGESEPQLRHLEATSANILESRNMIFSGTLVQSGDGKAVVYSTGMNTQFGHVVKLTKATEEVETPIRQELRRFTRIIGFIAIALGILFFAISLAIGKGQIASLIFAIGIIVANVPEGLLPTVTLALTMASRRMAKKNALIKNLESIETLGSTTVICTDKTGTLTQNRIRVNTIILNRKEFVAWERTILKQPGAKLLLDAMVLCNNAYLNPDGFSGDPTEGALLVYANGLVDITQINSRERCHELPFDSSTKRMITINRTGAPEGHTAWLKGAPEVVLHKCDSYLLKDAQQPMNDAMRQYFLDDFQRLAKRGERVLALAYRNIERATLSDESGFVLIGLIGMQDPPRPEVPNAIQRCRRAGIKVIMITGDFEITAETIARQVGLVRGEGVVIRGEDLATMSDEQLHSALTAPEIVFARTNPDQKLRIVRALQAQNEVVSVTGDGVNDAPALKNADMGVAMGLMGTDVAKEASDMVLMDDNFATIVSAVEEGRTIFENIKKFIAYILTSNVPEILPFIAYVLLNIPLPLTVIMILAIDLGTDILPALGLGSEKPESDVMRRPPRSRQERLLTRHLLFRSYGVVGMIQAVSGFFCYFVVLYHGGWSWGLELSSSDPLYRSAVTAFFASIVICQIANVMVCRTRRQSVFSLGALTNRLVILGIITELILLAVICYVPICNTFFGTAPLEAWQLLLSLPFALVIFFGDELRRMYIRKENTFAMKWLNW
ncbi:HAD-IC family P-type ATPase [Vibrio sp. CAU 1672]|uniref:cation-translocating P-type ATPase n=1 Tax=Vibrio sp. CAU 1672 TaxID=3032594 RepID=UPI0023D9E8EA|nr:HAD-IC family P-type ATPase [Vibrio sp. CAU 1672]MDF2153423.1 HAD-IC family P-type ATPase [Vibrio sp. CAU 1672]